MVYSLNLPINTKNLLPNSNTLKVLPEISKIWQDCYMECYYKMKYGEHWRWYYLNYEVNDEILL